MALGATVLTIVLAMTGYLESTGSTVVEQPAAAVAGIAVSFSALPALLVFLSLVPLARYRLRRHDIEADVAAGPLAAAGPAASAPANPDPASDPQETV